MSTTYQKILNNTRFTPPNHWMQIRTIDMHTGGEPLRVILEGFPALQGRNVLEYRRYCKEHYDHLRTSLLFEPRGHADMYGCILVPPNDEEADFGILFLHNAGYSTMCGHAVIAIAVLAVNMRWVEAGEGENVIKMDAPCGRIIAYVQIAEGQITDVRFDGVPSFVAGLDLQVEVPGLGTLTYDLAYGGAFYAYVDLRRHDLDLDLTTDSYNDLIRHGMAIKRAVIQSDQSFEHPFEADLSFLYGTIFIDDAIQPDIDSRNVCIFADGEVDRCPTGSGVCGRLAIHRARQELDIGQRLTVESITDSVFTGMVKEEVNYGPYKAVVPQVGGKAYITGMHTFVIDPLDTMQTGFILR